MNPDGGLSRCPHLAQSVLYERPNFIGDTVKRFALMFALALLVAACGDVDLSTSDTTPPETAPATTAVTAAAVEETVPSDDHGDDADSQGGQCGSCRR